MFCGDFINLYKDILICLLKEKDIEITFKGIEFDINKLLADRCYIALNEIKKILATANVNDEDCLNKIQRIVDTYKSLVVLETYDFSGQK